MNFIRLEKPDQVKNLTASEKKIYKGVSLFLAEKRRNEILQKEKRFPVENRIRAGFYVAWDPQSFYSLQKHIDRLNMVLPEWLFIDPKTDTLVVKADSSALSLIRQHNVPIVPILSNVDFTQKNGTFNGGSLHRIFRDPLQRKKLVASIILTLKKYHFKGVNIDFEDLHEKSDAPLVVFMKELGTACRSSGLLLTQDIVAGNDDYNLKELAAVNDYLFLMAYDQHYAKSTAGPICDQKWVEKFLDDAARQIPSEKIVLGIAAYGYDWPKGNEGIALTYQQALANADIYQEPIRFDNNSYNNSYSYTDDNGIAHEVYFTDAATAFNMMRFADENETAGTVLWRLGAEDERIWKFYGRDLSDQALDREKFNFSSLEHIDVSIEKPDYIGDGEVMDVIQTPKQGIIQLDIDTTDRIISEQKYLQLPTRYVIRKYGNVNKQVVLTFDDEPDPEYTPRILNILKREKVPAAFFIIGLNGESNLPLLKRIVRDGHEIGNHTFTHPNMAVVNKQRAQSELEATRLLIEAVTGRSTILFRVPYNADSEPATAEELKPVSLGKAYHYYTVGESIDPEDWEKTANEDTVYNRVIRRYEANPTKGIILLHDGGGNREATVRALPRIIHYFRKKNISIVSLEQLLGKSRDELMPVVNSELVKINTGVFESLYWIGKLLFSLFWIAIFLFLGKMLVMAILASVQFVKTRNEFLPPLVNPGGFARVSIIIPAYNEELNVLRTIRSILQQTYADFEILFVDDGSTDRTLEKVRQEYGDHPRVKILSKANGGKASALNEGVLRSQSEYVICIDADTQLLADAVENIMRYFNAGSGEKIGAVAGNVKVGNKNTMLTRWQHIEYTTAQNFDRRAFDLVNSISVIPGAIGAFRRKAVIEAGSFTSDTLAEDCDLTIRLLRKGYVIRNCPDAVAVTEAPETIRQFMKQRFRWNYGIMQSFWKNRDACFNIKFKSLGMVALPNILIYQIILPFFAPLADLLFIFSMVWNWNDPGSLGKLLFYYLVFMLVDIMTSVLAFSFEKEKLKYLFWLIPQRFVYRQLMYVILFRSMKKAIQGEGQGWGILKRTGSVQTVS